MAQFAKTFNVEERQLLVYIEFDVDREEEDSDQHVIHQIFQAPIGMVDVALKMPEAPARKVFDRYDQEIADNLFKTPMVLKILAVGAEQPTSEEIS